MECIDEAVPATLEIHLVMDHYGTHKMPKVQSWFARRPRYHLHFTPTSASWLNQVERFVGLLTGRRIRSGTFSSVRELEAAIRDHLAHHPANPTPFAWPAPIRFSRRSPSFVCELLTQDTSGRKTGPPAGAPWRPRPGGWGWPSRTWRAGPARGDGQMGSAAVFGRVWVEGAAQGANTPVFGAARMAPMGRGSGGWQPGCAERPPGGKRPGGRPPGRIHYKTRPKAARPQEILI